ncbi:MAG: methyltransferase domain-containing protein [Bacteroidales bacterium]
MNQQPFQKITDFLTRLSKENGVYFAGDKIKTVPFEDAYINSRKNEKRLLSDEMVKALPHLKNGPHQKEWGLRAKSAKRVFDYFSKIKNANLLDVGCGNGWFTSGIAQNPNIRVIGLDMNAIELQQASRIFQKNNLDFVFGDLFSLPFEKDSFQYITLVASIQYFKDLNVLINRLMKLLADKGEIHIVDSPFYTLSAIEAAKERTVNYYRQSGQEEMIGFYHHHSFNELKEWNYEILYSPGKNNFIRKFFQFHDIPFPWIKITKE